MILHPAIPDLSLKQRLISGANVADELYNPRAFYTIDEERQMVIVVKFLFQKSNWNAILRRVFPLI